MNKKRCIKAHEWQRGCVWVCVCGGGEAVDERERGVVLTGV